MEPGVVTELEREYGSTPVFFFLKISQRSLVFSCRNFQKEKEDFLLLWEITEKKKKEQVHLCMEPGVVTELEREYGLLLFSFFLRYLREISYFLVKNLRKKKRNSL